MMSTVAFAADAQDSGTLRGKPPEDTSGLVSLGCTMAQEKLVSDIQTQVSPQTKSAFQ